MKLRVLSMAVLAVALAGCSIANPGSGTKVGQVAKVIDEGLICKTTSVLITGKFGGGELRVTARPALREKVLHFQDTQEQVEVHYHTSFIRSQCDNDTENNILDSVEAHPEGAAK